MPSIISILCKSTMTKILNFNLSRLPSGWIFAFRHPYTVSMDVPYIGHPLERSDCWLDFWYFSKLLLIKPSVILVTSETFLVSGMKCDTSDPDYPKLVNTFFSSFATTLNNLCKTLPILFAQSYAPFHSSCVCIIWSPILNLEYLVLIYGCIWLLSWLSSRALILLDPSS